MLNVFIVQKAACIFKHHFPFLPQCQKTNNSTWLHYFGLLPMACLLLLCGKIVCLCCFQGSGKAGTLCVPASSVTCFMALSKSMQSWFGTLSSPALWSHANPWRASLLLAARRLPERIASSAGFGRGAFYIKKINKKLLWSVFTRSKWSRLEPRTIWSTSNAAEERKNEMRAGANSAVYSLYCQLYY